MLLCYYRLEWVLHLCSVNGSDAFHQQFHLPTLYQQLHVSLPELRRSGSEKDHVTFRAMPHIEGGSWFDFVGVLIAALEANGEFTELEYAAQILCFVELNQRESFTGDRDDSNLYVFVRYFVNAIPVYERNPVPHGGRHSDDLSVTHKVSNLPMVKLEPRVDARYDLLSVDAITGGLWVQQDFDQADLYWVLSSRLYFDS